MIGPCSTETFIALFLGLGCGGFIGAIAMAIVQINREESND